MLSHPDINPIALQLGSLKIHWYGLMYVLAFAGAWFFGSLRAKKMNSNWTSDQVGDFLVYAALGVVLGGRFGYVLFYDFSHFLSDPLYLFKIWQGGMSFHGGFLGVLVAILLYARNTGRTFIEISDFVMPLVPFGLAAGRLGNFINGELWGRVTNVPWGMVFPHVNNLPRHPSQLYEFLLEGVLLFIIVWTYSAKPRAPYAVTGLFMFFYGVFRFFIEFFRQPDAQYGFIAFDWLTMGQLLCVPMMIAGIVFFYIAFRQQQTQTIH